MTTQYDTVTTAAIHAQELFNFINNGTTFGRNGLIAKCTELGLESSRFAEKVRTEKTNYGKNELFKMLAQSFIDKMH